MQSLFTTLVQVFILTFLISIVGIVPTIWFQNKKYGKLPFGRGLLFILFVAYCSLLFVCSLIPLDDNLRQSFNIHPFNFIKNIVPESFSLKNPTQTVNSSSFYATTSMFFLCIPLGTFLKKLFNFSIYKTIVYAAIISAVLQILHLTGNFGLAQQYRVADIDDVLLATMGAILGWIAAPIFNFIPGSDIPHDQLHAPQRVNLSRRLTQLACDGLLYFVTSLAFNVIFSVLAAFRGLNAQSNHYTMLIVASKALSFLFATLILFVFIPLIRQGRTIGDMALRLQAVNKNGKQATTLQILIKAFTGFGLYGVLYAMSAFINLPFFFNPDFLAFISIAFILYKVSGISCLAAKLVLRDDRDLAGKHQHYVRS